MIKRLTLLQVVDKVILKFAKMGLEGWVRGTNAADATGNDVSPTSRKACKFCNQGVVMCVLKTANEDASGLRKVDNIFEDVNGRGMIPLNDDLETTLGANMENWFQLRSAIKSGTVKNVRV